MFFKQDLLIVILTNHNFQHEEENKQIENEITWYVPSLLHLDPYNKSWEENVKKIVHLQDLANQLSDSFTDLK
jgi:hypothetical protein